jgi:hypothetical protein
LADERAKEGVELGRSILKEEARLAARKARARARRVKSGLARLYEGEEMSESSEDEEDEWGREEDGSWTLALERSRRVAQRTESRGKKQQSSEEEGLKMAKSVSALKQAEREESMTSWRKHWSSAGVGRGLREVDPRPPGPAYDRHIHSLSSENASLLSRLRTDFNDLGATKRFLPDDSPDRLCACGEPERVRTSSTTVGRTGQRGGSFLKRLKRGEGVPSEVRTQVFKLFSIRALLHLSSATSIRLRVFLVSLLE